MNPIYEFGGSGSVLNIALANGFPPATYRPLLKPFIEHYRVTCVQPRALWGNDTQPPEPSTDWRDGLAADLLEGFRAHNLHDIVAVGHSFGGIASLLSVINEPSRFKALILLDPTIFSTELVELLDSLIANNMEDQMPAAARAIKRQRDFANIEDAFRYFRSRKLFDDWSDDALWIYADEGTYPTAEGVRLIWSPEWEAYYFKTFYTKTWDDLPRLRGLVPTLIIRGSESDIFTAESAESIRKILPEATLAEIQGYGHLFPQANHTETYQIMQDWLGRL